jgi:hypothetical protein
MVVGWIIGLRFVLWCCCALRIVDCCSRCAAETVTKIIVLCSIDKVAVIHTCRAYKTTIIGQNLHHDVGSVGFQRFESYCHKK